MARTITFGPIAVLLALALDLSGCGEQGQPQQPAADYIRPVKTLTIDNHNRSNYRYYPAKVRSFQRVKLAFQVSGQIIDFPIKAGDRVKKGQVIAALDPRDFRNTLDAAVAAYKVAKADYERYRKLIDKNAVSVSEFENKRKAYEMAEATMKIDQKALSDTKLPAPFDGIVAGTYMEQFENVAAKESILSLQNISWVELVINVPERDVIRSSGIRPAVEMDQTYQPVAVFPAIPDKVFPLQLKEFEIEADPTTQTFQIVMKMPAPQGYTVMPGMTALVRVLRPGVIPGKTGGFMVPVEAVGNDGGGAYVWVIDSGHRVHKRPVQLGIMRGERINVTQGLTAGETIVTAGIQLLQEGMTVRKLTHIGSRELADPAPEEQP
ncbi:MAG: efflux RND transporter periplasmic adaptor subunit [Victivallales bacterium]|nr:efflux RND transporter periplasmic adaptor subunit [Victivallales bacterium]